MNTVYIIFKTGEVTTIKSRLALTIATGFLSDWFNMEDFICVPGHTNKQKVFYLLEKGLKIDPILHI